MNNEVSAKGLEATLKSTDTEEWIDLLFYRPIGYRWALLFRHLGVTPNAITIASIFRSPIIFWKININIIPFSIFNYYYLTAKFIIIFFSSPISFFTH